MLARSGLFSLLLLGIKRLDLELSRGVHEVRRAGNIVLHASLAIGCEGETRVSRDAITAQKELCGISTWRGSGAAKTH